MSFDLGTGVDCRQWRGQCSRGKFGVSAPVVVELWANMNQTDDVTL